MATATTRSKKTAEPKPEAKATPAKTATRTAKPKAGVRFNAEDLPQTGTGQLRHGGDYKPSIRALAAFAKGDATNSAHVKALIHLGWVKPGGDNNASKSPAFTIADNAGLPEEAWNVGEAAGPQIAANLQALAEAGAPEEALDGLWAAYLAV
jgi:hypothetical protein